MKKTELAECLDLLCRADQILGTQRQAILSAQLSVVIGKVEVLVQGNG